MAEVVETKALDPGSRIFHPAATVLRRCGKGGGCDEYSHRAGRRGDARYDSDAHLGTL